MVDDEAGGFASGHRSADSRHTDRSVKFMFDEGLCNVLNRAAGNNDVDMKALVAAVARAEVDVKRETNAATLWRMLVGGLLLLMVMDMILLFYAAVADKNASQAAITIFTTALSGLLGLFVRPPGHSGEGTSKIGVPASTEVSQALRTDGADS